MRNADRTRLPSKISRTRRGVRHWLGMRVTPVAIALWSVAAHSLLWPPVELGADELPAEVREQGYALESAAGLLAADHTAKFLGPRSCAATACHGAVDPDPRTALIQRNEYASWLTRDPHARSLRTLSNERSQLILQRLARAGEDIRAQAKRLANCFACHNPQPATARQASSYFPRDGVSCEICHGAAEDWIGAHVAADWSREKVNDRQAWLERVGKLGFVDTERLEVRGSMCAQCHVGSPGREVNHDLIAAGHPVLKFELAAYHELLPKHWRAEQERQADPQFETALWASGQVAAADAALSLLQWRADAKTAKHPDAAWPEFAEYDCFACHHDLQHPSWRRQRTVAGLPLGMPAWGTWYFGPWRQMHDGGGENLQTLTEQMQSGFGQDRQQIQDAVAAAQQQLEPWRVTSSTAPVATRMRTALRELVEQPREDNPGAPPANWDEAVQLYLAIVALDQASGRISADRFAATRALFSFPELYDSPRGFLGNRLPGTSQEAPETPHHRSRKQVLAALVALARQLENVSQGSADQTSADQRSGN